MKKLIVFSAVFFFSLNVFSQVIGGFQNKDIAPGTTVSPAKLTGGGLVGDVNVFTGTYSNSYSLGTVSTPSGINFSLNLNYSPSYSTGNTIPVSTGIPYGEGWNLNVPTISVKTDVYNEYFNDECGIANSTNSGRIISYENRSEYEKLYWFSPEINIPGVASGVAVFKYVDNTTDLPVAVFSLNSFDKYVEIRFQTGRFEVITEDGTVYKFDKLQKNYRSPSSTRYYNYSEVDFHSERRTVEDPATQNSELQGNFFPTEDFGTWYCTYITNHNAPFYQGIWFDYDVYGEYNYFQELNQNYYFRRYLNHLLKLPNLAQLDYVPSFVSYTDVILKSVQSFVGNTFVDQIDLVYETDYANGTTGMLVKGQDGVSAHDDLYNKKVIYSTDISGKSDWTRYYHIKSSEAYSRLGYEVPFSGTNPYVGSINGLPAYIVEKVQNTNSYTYFNNSFLESPRINNDVVPGDIYEVRAQISSPIQVGGGTVDVNVVTGEGTGFTVDPGNNNVYYKQHYDGTRGTSVFNTFGQAVKWQANQSTSSTSNIRSNFFVMPQIPLGNHGINLQYGPGNSETEYTVDIAGSTLEEEANYYNSSQKKPYAAYTYYFYRLRNQVLTHLSNNSSLRTQGKLLPGDAPASHFGIGLPWAMLFNVYFGRNENPSPSNILDAYENYANFWWRHRDIAANYRDYDNQPTALGSNSAGIGKVELVRYCKNPYMLKKVRAYKYFGNNDEREGVSNKHLVSELELIYEVDIKQVQQKEYSKEFPAKYTTTLATRVQNVFLLSEIIQVPIDPTQHLTSLENQGIEVPNTVPINPKTKFVYSEMASNLEDVFFPLRGVVFNRKPGVVLTDIYEQVGGHTRVEYYPGYMSYFKNRNLMNKCLSSYTSILDAINSYSNFAMDVVPIVKQIIRSGGNGEAAQITDYEYGQKVDKIENISTGIVSDKFYRSYLSSVQGGFRTTKVTLPEISPGVRPYSIYEHFGSGVEMKHKDFIFIEEIKTNTSLIQLEKLKLKYEEKYGNYFTYIYLGQDNFGIHSAIFKYPEFGEIVYYAKDINSLNELEQSLSSLKLYFEYLYGDMLLYEKCNEELTITFGIPNKDFIDNHGGVSPEQAYLYFGKIKNITEYTHNGKKIKEHLFEYNHTLAFKHGMEPIYSNGSNGARIDNRADGEYLGNREHFDQNSFGDYVEDFATVSGLLDFVYYPIIKDNNPAHRINSYFVKKERERIRTYDTTEIRTTSKLNILVKNHQVSSSPEKRETPPGKGGHKNDLPPSDREQVEIIINENNAVKATQKILELGPISDYSLHYVIERTDKLGSLNVKEILVYQNRLSDEIQKKVLDNSLIKNQQKEDVLMAQPYLTQEVLSRVVMRCPELPSAAVERIAKQQQWSTEFVLDKALKNDKFMNNNLQGVFMHQPYALSEKILIEYVERHPNLSESQIKEFLLRQPVIGNELIRTIIRKEPKVNSKTLFELIYFSEEFPNDVVFNEIITSQILTPQDMEGLIEIKPSPLTDLQITSLESIEKYSSINALTPEQGYVSQCTSGSLRESYSFIENSTEYEYYEADYLGRPTSSAYQEFNTQNIIFEPSWQLYRTKSYSPQLNRVFTENKLHYYYDVRNTTQDRYLGDSEVVYNRMIRNIPYQNTIITQNTSGEKVEKSTYYVYELAPFNVDNEGYPFLETIDEEGEPCEEEESPIDPAAQAYLMECREFKHKGGEVSEYLFPGECAIYILPDAELGTYGVRACKQNHADYIVELIPDYVTLLDCVPLPEVNDGLGRPAFNNNYFVYKQTAIQIDTVSLNSNSNGQYSKFADIPHEEKLMRFNYSTVTFPFDILVTNTILSRNVYGQVTLEKDASDLQTKYEYPIGGLVWHRHECRHLNYYSFNTPGFKPTKITVGFERDDALIGEYEYYPSYHIKKTISPTSVIHEYFYDKLGRLFELKENNRLLNRTFYNYWDDNLSASFKDRAAQNFVQTFNFTNEGDYDNAELITSYTDPLGREYNTTWKHHFEGISPINNNTFSSGQTLYDAWDRVVRTYKPFAVVAASETPLLNEDVMGAPQIYSAMLVESNQRSRPYIMAKPGQQITGTRNVKQKYRILNYLAFKCELDLNSNEESWFFDGRPTGFMFTKTETIDEDGKMFLEYFNAMGQKVASKQILSNKYGPITLFFYDSQHNLTKVVNPKKQISDYLYNMTGNIYLKSTPDEGVVKYMYNKRGQVVLIEDANARNGEKHELKMSSIEYQQDGLVGNNIVTPYFREFKYDIYGRLVEQNKIQAQTDCFTSSIFSQDFTANKAPDQEEEEEEEPEQPSSGADQYGNYWVTSACEYSDAQTWLSYSNLPLLKYETHSQNIGEQDYIDYVFSNKSTYNFSAGITVRTITCCSEASYGVAELPLNVFSMYSKLNRVHEKTWEYNTIGQLEKTEAYGNDQIIDYSDSPQLAKLINLYHYDYLGRISEVETLFNADGGLNTLSSKNTILSYNLRGSIEQESVEFYGAELTPEKLLYRYTYDVFNQLRAIEAKQLTDAHYTKVVEYDYDDALKLLTKKRTYATDENGVAYVADETIYTYDERDRLTNMEGQLYGNRLYYDAQTLTGVNQSQNYNGNINAVSHSYKLLGINTNYTAGQGFDTPTHYGYRYDGINRMTVADANLGSGYNTNLGDVEVSYDIIGNITTLKRNEVGNNTNSSVLRNLSYTYQTDNNRLTEVSGFENNEKRRYTYDSNGNLLTNQLIQTSTVYGRGNYPFKLKLNQSISYGSQMLGQTALETHNSILYLYNDQDQRIYKRSENGERNFTPATGEITSENKTITAEEYYVTNAMGQTVAVMDLFNNQATWYINGHDRVAKLTLTQPEQPERPAPPTGGLHTPPLPLLAGVSTYTALRTTLMRTEYGLPTTLMQKLKRELLPFVAGVLVAKASNAIINNSVILNDSEGSQASQQGTNTAPLTLSYYVNDYLGNTRMVYTPSIQVNELTKQTEFTYTIESMHDYYPYGKILRTWGDNEKYLSTQHERDTETNFDYRGARYYDSDVARFLSVDPLAADYAAWSTYNYVLSNPVMFIDPTGMGADDWVQRGNGSIYWDKNANDQASTKDGEKYLGKTLTFTFNSYIDANLWDGPGGSAPTGNKLTSTINITGNENSEGELIGIYATKNVKVGNTPLGTARDYFPGLGSDQNKFTYRQTKNSDGTLSTYNLNFEQHASVSRIEEFGLNSLGYDIVNVAQRATFNLSSNELSISAATDIFPSATLKLNGTQLFKYNQPSFNDTHGRDHYGLDKDYSIPRRPEPNFYQRYNK